MSDTVVIWGIGALLAVAATVPFLARNRRRERATLEAEAEARALGLDEPASLHPVVDHDGCIGTGACTEVCPEGDVIGFLHGQARVVSPAKCIGHGLCERACPVDAIKLVFGTAARGVDIPRIQGNFETNVPGIYIVGELGGMGLIRNAFEQGRQCVDGIRREARGQSKDPSILDLLIVGCGPAGLSASLSARRAGLRFETIEREQMGGAVRHYPRKKLVMTQPIKVPGFGKVGRREMLKEELIELWERLASEAGLTIRTGETVESVDRRPDGSFEVSTDRSHYRTLRVVLAIGRRGLPRKLGVPGEESPNVSYALLEPESYRGDRVLVVGGGDSAVEAALALSREPGTDVRLSYRRDSFPRIKAGNRARLEAAESEERVRVHRTTEVDRIERSKVVLRGESGTEPIPNDQVFIFAGGELPTRFLAECGVVVDTKFGVP